MFYSLGDYHRISRWEVTFITLFFPRKYFYLIPILGYEGGAKNL
jgi:hypothetical protein